MGLAHLARQALAMPPRQALAKTARFALRLAAGPLQSALHRFHRSYPETGPRLGRRLGAIDFACLEANAAVLRALAPLYRDHRFDLLGSGWVQVAHGARYAGFGPWHYGPGAGLPTDWRAALAAQCRPADRRRARALLDLIDDGYRPIDWHVDFKSGHRWSPRAWGPGTAYGHRPGIDVKVPWELARLRHLPHLALAFALDRDPALPREFCNQALDFLAANPPGWGVNWASAMDVAIRAANLLLARDLFLAAGWAFDDAFEAELAAGILAHGRFVAAHLETRGVRGNHYLADICGLAFIAAYLSEESWLAFAARELAAEIPRQFLLDGGNFEASTCYHRLSAEMAIYASALLLGLGARVPDDARLAGAIRFAFDSAKPSGAMVQIGDSDSGRFLAPAPLFDLTPAGPVERGLDCGALIAAGKGLFALDLPAAAEAAIETRVVAALAGGRRAAAAAAPARIAGREPPPAGTATRLVRLRLVPADAAALSGLQPVGYPDFGLFLWKGRRAFLSFRCGPVGQHGNGGHAHNDQLAVELEIDGIAWAADPGSFVYTADLKARDRYRSALAHFVPRCGTAEPARLLAPFRLEDRAQARLLRFDGDEIAGWHCGFGAPVLRRVSLAGGAVVVEDLHGGGLVGPETRIEEHIVRSPAELAGLWGLSLPFSAGYGRGPVDEGDR